MTHLEKIEAIRRVCIEANPNRGPEDEPCRLADVLLAIRKTEKCTIEIHPQADQRIKIRPWETTEGGSWLLNQDDLALQDPKTIDFIHEILKV